MNFLKITFSEEGKLTIQKDEYNVWDYSLDKVAEKIWERRVELQEKITKLKGSFGILSQINLFLLPKEHRGAKVEYINVRIVDFDGVAFVFPIWLQKEAGIKGEIDDLKKYLRRPKLRLF